jgi:hypothetical protein
VERLRLGQDAPAGAAKVAGQPLAIGSRQRCVLLDQGPAPRWCADSSPSWRNALRAASNVFASLFAHLLDGRFCERLEVRLAAVQVVEAARDLARDLDVRRLVLADRHERGAVDQDVGGLQQRVAEEAVGREIAVLQLLDLSL